MFDFYIDKSNYLDFSVSDFTIKKGSELPFLEIKPIPTTNFEVLLDLLPNMKVSFSMLNIKTNTYTILNKYININLETYTNKVSENQDTCRSIKDFSIRYFFNKNETKIPGSYIGEFKIHITENNEIKTLIVPIKNKLNIIITD